MTDNLLISLLISTLNAGLTARGLTIAVKQANQPTQQGANLQPTAYIVKLFDMRYGYSKRLDAWNSNTAQIDHIEQQQYESTFQITALALQDPMDINSLTAADVANYCAAALQDDAAIGAFQAQGVGLLRVGQVRNPYIVNDSDQFEATPSFDVVLRHTQSYTSAGVALTTTEAGFYRI